MSQDTRDTTELPMHEKRALAARLLKEKASTLKAVYPLSYTQRAMWFLYQLAPESAAYNVAFTARIRSEVDVPTLVRAFQTLLDRHPVLRTVFTDRSGQPVQEVYGYRDLHFEQIDSASWTDPELDDQVAQAYARPFDLERGPILRVYLFTRSSTEHVLLLTVHHIACDGWSLWLLLDEFRVLYGALRKGAPAPLAAPKARYTDYVQWQAQMLAGPEGEKLEAYWRQQLAGELPVLDLPTDRPRPPVQTYHGGSNLCTLDEELAQQLKALAKAEGATLYMVLLAAFQVLLYRYTGQDEIIVGSPTFGRSRAEWATIVGDFVNTVVLRSDLGGDPTFREFLSQVRDTVLAALAHQEYPFPLLVERLRPARDPSRSPLVQVLFGLQQPQQLKDLPNHVLSGERETALDFGGLALEPLALAQQEGQFDLALETMELGRSLLVILKYNTDLFEADTIARMMGHLKTLLAGIVANPHCRLSECPLLSEAEVYELTVAPNQTWMDYARDQCLHQLFETQVEQSPWAMAVSSEQEQLTYRQLNERSNQLAHYLQQIGVGPETLVGIFVERSVDMIVGLLGVLKAGGAYVPLDPAFPQERLAFMLADSGTTVLLTQQKLREAIPNPKARVICLDSDWPAVAQQSSDNLVCRAAPSNLAYVLYTSGSTGKPKGVQIPHQAVVNFLTSMRHEPGLTARDVLLSVTTLSFDIAVLELFLPLITGAQVVLADRETAADGPHLMIKIESSQATVMQATPTTWRMLIDAGWNGSHQLKVFCGGEPLPRDLADQLLARTASVWNMYGPTETTVWSAIARVQANNQPISIGRPIGNTQLYVLDRHLRPVPVGVEGELYIGGDGLARGYLNRPDLTAESFMPDPFGQSVGARLYKTGDLVRYRALGQIEFRGRVDYQIKIRGFRVELGEIEMVLVQHPAIREAVVIVRQDHPGDKRLVAYLIAQDPQAVPTTTDLRRFVAQKLPDYMVPVAFVFMAAYPLTPNRKLDRKALPAPDQSRPVLANQFVAPRTEAEKVIAGTIADLLKLDQVGIGDNFFELGGDSLRATQVVSRLRASFDLELPLRSLFEATTVADLARYIETVLAAARDLGGVYEVAGDDREVVEL